MIKAIFLNGPPRTGKDTLADLLVEHFGFGIGMKFKFADLLKVKTHRFFIDAPHHEAFENPNFFESVKERPTKLFHGMSPRAAYIWMSEEVIKPKFGQEYFGQKVADNVEMIKTHLNKKLQYVFIADSGFLEEVKPMRNIASPEAGMLVVHLQRAGKQYGGDSRNYIQPTNIPIIEVENVEGDPSIAFNAILNDMNKRWGNEDTK